MNDEKSDKIISLLKRNKKYDEIIFLLNIFILAFLLYWTFQ